MSSRSYSLELSERVLKVTVRPNCGVARCSESSCTQVHSGSCAPCALRFSLLATLLKHVLTAIQAGYCRYPPLHWRDMGKATAYCLSRQAQRGAEYHRPVSKSRPALHRVTRNASTPFRGLPCGRVPHPREHGFNRPYPASAHEYLAASVDEVSRAL